MKRSLIMAVAGVCTLVGGFAASPALAADPTPYVVRMVSNQDSWEAIRMDTRTGESWLASGGNWQTIPTEGGNPGRGSVGTFVLLIADLDDTYWEAIRYNSETGESWRLSESKWWFMEDPSGSSSSSGGSSSGGGRPSKFDR